MPLRPAQIPHELARDRTRTSAEHLEEEAFILIQSIRINAKFTHSLLLWTVNANYNRIVSTDTENEHMEQQQQQQQLLPDSAGRSAAGWEVSIASLLVYYTVSRSVISVHVITISPCGSPTVKPCRVFRDPRSLYTNKLRILTGTFNLQLCTEIIKSNTSSSCVSWTLCKINAARPRTETHLKSNSLTSITNMTRECINIIGIKVVLVIGTD